MPRRSPSLADYITAAAAALPQAQRRLDADFRGRAERFAQETGQLAAGPGVAPGVGALVQSVRPRPFRIATQDVTFVAELTTRRDREVAVGLRVGGRLVAAFYAARYTTTAARTSTVTVTTVNAPAAGAPAGGT